MDQPNRLVSRSELAAGPMSNAVERMAPMASADRPTATARATMNSEPTSLHPHAPGRRRLGAQRAQEKGPEDEGDQAERQQATDHDDGHRRGVDGEDGAEEDLLGGARDRLRGRVEVEEQGGEAGGRAEHDAGGHVAAPHALHPDEVHGQRAEDPAPQEPGQGTQPSSSAPEPPAVDTSARECPAKDWPRRTVNTPTTAETTATTAADDERGLHRRAGEEAGLEEPAHSSAHLVRRVDREGAPASRPGPATTMTRPCTLSTSTW